MEWIWMTDETFQYKERLITAHDLAAVSKKNGEVFNAQNSNFNWSWILQSMAYCLTANANRIATNSIHLSTFFDIFDKILKCFPPLPMPKDVDIAYYCFLNSLHKVSFPVPKIVNRTLRIGLEQSKTTFSYYNTCIFTPDGISKLSFFLKNANNDQNKLVLNGYRFSDFILSEFYRWDCPQALLKLLQYGSCEMLEKGVQNMQSLKVGCANVSECCLMDLLDYCLTMAYQCKQIEKDLLNMIQCLKYLMSAINVLPLEKLYTYISSSNCNQIKFAAFYAMILNGNLQTYCNLQTYKEMHMSTLKMLNLPNLEEKLGLTASSLKHICRMKIRSTLYKNWSLPHGIKMLDIPESLHDYLNISQ